MVCATGWRSASLVYLMAIFTAIVLAQVLFSKGPMGYDKWAGIFSTQWMKTLTFCVIVALLYHAWIGMREIFMDYVKPLSVATIAPGVRDCLACRAAQAGPSRSCGAFDPLNY
jgi:succinate dehydrogenase hydrophobic membrane anchor protein